MTDREERAIGLNYISDSEKYKYKGKGKKVTPQRDFTGYQLCVLIAM